MYVGYVNELKDELDTILNQSHDDFECNDNLWEVIRTIRDWITFGLYWCANYDTGALWQHGGDTHDDDTGSGRSRFENIFKVVFDSSRRVFRNDPDGTEASPYPYDPPECETPYLYFLNELQAVIEEMRWINLGLQTYPLEHAHEGNNYIQVNIPPGEGEATAADFIDELWVRWNAVTDPDASFNYTHPGAVYRTHTFLESPANNFYGNQTDSRMHGYVDIPTGADGLKFVALELASYVETVFSTTWVKIPEQWYIDCYMGTVKDLSWDAAGYSLAGSLAIPDAKYHPITPILLVGNLTGFTAGVRNYYQFRVRPQKLEGLASYGYCNAVQHIGESTGNELGVRFIGHIP
jgi:hypothetical protein